MADSKISALTAVGTPAGTDEFAVNQAGTSKKMTLAQVQAPLVNPAFPAGTSTAGSWPKLTAGTVQTTPDAGSVELDSNALYVTTDAGNRGVVPVRNLARADSTRTFTSNTSAQAIFTSPTNGRLTIETGCYLFRGMLAFTGMSATSGNLVFDVKGAGTATLGSVLMHTWGQDAAAAAAPSAVGGQWVATNVNTTNAVTAAVGTSLMLQVNGTLECTSAGTLVPSITMTTASASVLSVGSYLFFERIGSTSLVSIGQWD